MTTTTHKTLGGPRGGVILCDSDYAKKIDSAVFPGQQGGPLEHVIAAKAVASKIAGEDEFRDRQQRTLKGAQILADRLTADGMVAPRQGYVRASRHPRGSSAAAIATTRAG